MKLIKSAHAAVFGLVFTFCSTAFAADFTARVTNLLIFEGGDLVYVYVEGGTKGKPSCAGINGDYISFSMKRPRAKEYLAGLMFAFGAGKPVSFWTAGACVDQSFSDTLSYFMVNNG